MIGPTDADDYLANTAEQDRVKRVASVLGEGYPLGDCSCAGGHSMVFDGHRECYAGSFATYARHEFRVWEHHSDG